MSDYINNIRKLLIGKLHSLYTENKISVDVCYNDGLQYIPKEFLKIKDHGSTITNDDYEKILIWADENRNVAKITWCDIVSVLH